MTFQPAPDMARLMCVHAVPFCDAPADEGAGASRSPLLSGALRNRVLHVAGTLAGILRRARAGRRDSSLASGSDGLAVWSGYDMTTIQPLRAALRPGEQQCTHRPPCPGALAHDRSGARTMASHPEQGWSLLCNGVVIFDDGGALLPDGRTVLPPPTCAHLVAPAA